MSINMEPGQSVIFEKSDSDFSKVVFGLGWDIREEKNQFIPSFFGKKESFNFDLDAFALLLDDRGKVQVVPDDLIYYGNLKSGNGHIEHKGDNLTGQGEGDDEQIEINLSALSERHHQIIVGVNIHKGVERKQDFSRVENAFVRVCDAGDKEVCRFNLTTHRYKGHTTMFLGNLYKRQNRWKLLALGEPKLGNLQDLLIGFSSPELLKNKRVIDQMNWEK